MKNENGGPAFPVNVDPHAFQPKSLEELKRLASGMALRDYFAAKAMQAIIGAEIEAYYSGKTNAVREANVAKSAYLFADSMLEARKDAEQK